jgi:hypothetical protein
MKHEEFVSIAEEALDSLPEFCSQTIQGTLYISLHVSYGILRSHVERSSGLHSPLC